MASPVQTTTGDKLSILPVVGGALGAALYRTVSRPFVSGPKANTALKDSLFAGLRVSLGSISPGTEQWINSTTEAEYLKLAKSKKFQPETSVLSSGVKAHWLGPKTSDKILLYFHGGGYVQAASAGHTQWLYDLQTELAKTSKFSIVLLSYTLAPHAQYPSQLKEAAESLQWLIDDQKKTAGNIFIGGDSAGGNMALMLFSHLLHPHDSANNITLSEPLAGAFLVSPWTKFATDDDSVRRNQNSDMVTPAAARRWSSLFLGSGKIDNYNQTIIVDDSWFQGLDGVVKDILVWGGGGEVLIDSIDVSTKKLQKAHPRVEYVVQPGAAHVDFILDKVLGYKKKGEGELTIERWMKARV